MQLSLQRWARVPVAAASSMRLWCRTTLIQKTMLSCVAVELWGLSCSILCGVIGHVLAVLTYIAATVNTVTPEKVHREENPWASPTR